ncbi:mga helix-turn-helix domain-containing protein [Listeria fleischmannii 1991]|nr:helix-turn-helix domain-containing protein [Listeria fleischmannii]KMT61427.1 mga helix-turn-helix domain-containing protein [Listeria fleischmannii 1991]
MDELHTKLIFPKSLQRQSIILNKLFESSTALSVNELSQELDVSVRTIVNDLDYLTDMLPSTVKINIDKFKLINLESTDSYAFYEFLTTVVTISPLYKIIDSLFIDELHNLEDWADILFVSEKTLQRYLFKLRELLEVYELKLSFNPVNIVGQEENIRLFFYAFYASGNLHLRSPGGMEKEITEKLSEALSEHIELIRTQKTRSLYWAMILYRRYRQGKYINTSISKDNFPGYFDTYKNIHIEIIEAYGIDTKKMPDEEFLFIDYLALENILYSVGNTYSEFRMRKMIDNSVNYRFLEFILIHEFKINSKIGEAMRTHTMLFNNMQALSQFSPLFQKNKIELNLMIKKKYPIIFNKWLKIMRKYDLTRSRFIEYLEDFCVKLTMLTSLYVEQEHIYRRVVFILTGENIYIDYITNQFKKMNSEDININFKYDTYIQKGLLESTDIFITNTKVRLEGAEEAGIPVIYVSLFPTSSDFQRIESLLNWE